jgi:hypothetical protein
MTGGGAIDASVTLDEVLTVVGTRRVPLAPELAGYLVLEIAEHADPGGGEVEPRSVFIGEEGSVALVKARREAEIEGAEASVRGMLARLLDASGTQTPALAATAKRRSGSGLQALAQEIEAALIPVNRAAGRRALARLAREVKRVTLGVGRNALPSSSDGAPSTRRASSPSSPPYSGGREPQREDEPPPSSSGFSKEEQPTTTRNVIPEELLKKATPVDPGELPTIQFIPPHRSPTTSQADVDKLIDEFSVSGDSEKQHARDLKAIAGLEPTPPPPTRTSDPGDDDAGALGRPDTNESDVEALLEMSGGHATSPARKAKSDRKAESKPDTKPDQKPDSRQLPTQPSTLRRSAESLPGATKTPPKRRGSAGVAGAALIALGVGAVGVWQLRLFAPAAPAAAPPPAVTPAAPKGPPPCVGTLIVTDVPQHAEALLRAGQAPVDVEKMPVGARLEFVATAEGFVPRRVVVPTGATWDRGADGKPRFEAAAQLEKSRAKAGANDPWPAGEPGSEVGGQGPPGTVHVVTTPRGAEVWMLAGIGPEVRIEQLRCDRDLEVLIAGPTTFRRRLRVAASEFRADGADAGEGVASAGGAGGSGSGNGAAGPGKIARVSAK